MTSTLSAAATRRALRGFAARRPKWLAVLSVLVYALPQLALIVAAPEGATFTPTADPLHFAVIGWSVLVPAALLTGLGWWGVAGFGTRSTGRSLMVFLPVIVLYNLLPLLTLAPDGAGHDATYLVLVATTVIAGGFGDEALFRGVVLQALLPRGSRRAVITSSVLFGAAYLRVMALDVDPAHVGIQAANSVGMGIAFAALIVVTGTIWPVVLISAASQIAFYLTYVPDARPDVVTIGIELAMGALAGAYGLWLLHRHEHRRAGPS